jgi:SAM-dependent methyltransferase
MPDNREIYNHVVASDERYNLAENSPGFRAVVQATDQLSMIAGRSLDVGCGVGFVVEYLSGPSFDLKAFGVDISDQAIEKAKSRLSSVPGSQQRLVVLEGQSLPFENGFFSLVTCFDVLEHLDPEDIDATLNEVTRVLRPGGIFFGSVSCRKSGVDDIHGDNLHRTVKSPDWWIEKLAPDSAHFDGQREQLSLWKHMPLIETANFTGDDESEPEIATESKSMSDLPHKNSAALYQKIYDENPWYGDADQGRCPGVRLLPSYRKWLIEPVMDLGCGRGQTVDHLRQLGLAADGIDQIKINPEMRVGDITQPIEDLKDYNSVVCVDCIEHLFEGQVLGLFENMKQVKHQAFSIHNGESTGTGQELHVNRKSFEDWDALISQHFEIVEKIAIHDEQMLYLTQLISKSGR